MYRFLLRPKWILFHLLVVAGIYGMLNASKWQWDRYNSREAFVERVETRNDPRRTPPVPLVELLDKRIDDIEYLIATAQGSYLPDGQLIQIQRSQDGYTGVNVLTPFQIEDGPVVLVNRGFVPDRADVPAAPSGQLLIGGTVRTSQKRQTFQLTDNASGDDVEVRRVDLPLIEQRIDMDLAPVYLEFINSVPATPTPPTRLPAPDLTDGPSHLSYTIQWLIFAIAVGVGWFLAVRRSSRPKRLVALSATGATTTQRAASPPLGQDRTSTNTRKDRMMDGGK